MIVVITSWAPTVAFRKPAIPPQIAPARIDAASASEDVQRRAAVPSRCAPTKSAAMNPTQYWPWPPMLNMPQRKANATARAVQDQRRHDDQRLLQVVGGRAPGSRR